MSTQHPTGTGARYHRVSTTKQDFERQVADIDRWLMRHGLQDPQTFEDQGSRDKAEERFQFQAMLRMVQAGALRWVVVQSIDRLGFKDTYEFFEFLSIFRRHGCQLWSAIDDACISHSDDSRVILNTVAGLTSTREQVEKANRVQTKRVQKGLRGEYQGGFPPYALDVVCRSSDGREKFRYVLLHGERKHVGHKPNRHPIYHTTIRGLKVTPTNPQGEHCEGVPAHDKGDVLVLSPTVRTDRIEVIKRIYMLLDTEATNCGRVAERLNRDGVDPVVGRRWTAIRVRDLVINPAYMGLPATNKKGQPRFFEVREGRPVRVETQGAVKQKRRPRSEWIMPSAPVFDPLVDPARWERVNAKIAPTERRAPRNEQLYLAGLLHCGHCGQMMYGFMVQHRSKKTKAILRTVPYYQCSTRNKYGPDNPTGCGFHGTATKTIEPYIAEFLARRGQTLDDLLSKERDGAALERLLRERAEHDAEMRATLERMRRFVGENFNQALADGIDNGDGVVCSMTLAEIHRPELPGPEQVEAMNIVDLYDLLIDHKASRLRLSLAGLEAEHMALVEKVRHLTAPLLIERVNREAEALEGRMAALRAELEPLSERFMDLMASLRHLRERVAEAEHAMSQGSNRMKAAALRACIERVECRWERGTRARLVQVTVVPKLGEPQVFAVANDTVLSKDATGRRG